VHGTMDRASSFGRLMTRLADWPIVAYDRRGYAGSIGVGPSERFDDQVDDLLSVAGERPLLAVGHSYGGNVVLAAAQRRPDVIVGALVWEAPRMWEATGRRSAAADAARSDRPPEEQAEDFMRRMVGERVWSSLPARTKAQRRAEGPTLVAELRALAAGAPYDPARVPIPVLSGYGSASRPHQRANAAMAALRLPQGRCVVVAGAQHGVHLSHPADLAALVHDLARWVYGDATV